MGNTALESSTETDGAGSSPGDALPGLSLVRVTPEQVGRLPKLAGSGDGPREFD